MRRHFLLKLRLIVVLSGINPIEKVLHIGFLRESVVEVILAGHAAPQLDADPLPWKTAVLPWCRYSIHVQTISLRPEHLSFEPRPDR
jgi:hypothetical protein